MDIELQQQTHETTEVELPQQGVDASETPSTPKEQPDQPLTASNIAERARAALEKSGKKPTDTTPSPGQPGRGADGKFLSKNGEAKPKAPEAAGAAQGASNPDNGEGQGGEKEAAPAEKFTPNPKFNALGKEYELPKWMAEAITSPEQETELKELHTKAMGLEHVKMRHQELYTKHEQMTATHNELVGGVSELREIYTDAVKSENLLRLGDFFKKLEIPDQVVLQYAAQRLQYLQLPDDQRQILDGALMNQRQVQELTKQNQMLTSSHTSAESQALGTKMDMALARPDISAVVQAFDSAPGRKPGDFRERVRQHGEYQWYVTKGLTVLAPEEAIQQVMAQFGLTPQAQVPAPNPGQTPPPAAAPTGQAPATPVVPAPHRQVPTIPTISGKAGASPMKQKPRSIADLKKLGKEMGT